MRLKVLFHDHCFDGVASAATFIRFHRERIGAAEVACAGLAHRAGNVFPDGVLDGDHNAVVDFRYTRDPRLTWWFDHHVSAFASAEDELHFKNDISGKKFHDPRAASCTRFLARVAAERFGFDPAPLSELIHWAEIIDGAQFPDARTAVDLTEPAMKLMLVVEATRDPAFCPRLVAALADRTLSQVVAEPWVLAALGPLFQSHRQIVQAVGERARLERGVATYDLADLGIDNVNKFIAYHLFPECRYAVAVTLAPSRAKVSVGSNPWYGWRAGERRHNLARLCEPYGGGGHPAVAAISYPPDRIAEARAAAEKIASALRSED